MLRALWTGISIEPGEKGHFWCEADGNGSIACDLRLRANGSVEPPVGCEGATCQLSCPSMGTLLPKWVSRCSGPPLPILRFCKPIYDLLRSCSLDGMAGENLRAVGRPDTSSGAPPGAGFLKTVTASTRSLMLPPLSPAPIYLSIRGRAAPTDPRRVSEKPRLHSDGPVSGFPTPRTAIIGQRTSLLIAASP